MKELKRVFKSINKRDFGRYLFFSILLVAVLVSIGRFNFTQARYESEVTANVSPSLAFFIVDVTNQSGQIKLQGIVPSDVAYTFEFYVSNFDATRHAEVDLTYSIEIVTTTNMPLDFRIYKGNDLQLDQIDHDITTTDDNGVYYRHLIIDDASTMNFANNVTDKYTLWVKFPIENKDYPDSYEGIIDLVDVVIRAEQVV